MTTHGILWTYEHYSEFWTLFLAYLEENKCTDIIHWRKHHTQHSQMLSSRHERHTCSPEWECEATSFTLRGWRTSNNHIIGQNPWCVKEGPAVISLVMLLHNVWSYAIQSEISLIKITDNHISRVFWPPVCIPPAQTWQYIQWVLQKNQWCTCFLVIHPPFAVVLAFCLSQASSWTVGRIKVALNKAGRLGNMIPACSVSLWQRDGQRELKTSLETGRLLRGTT